MIEVLQSDSFKRWLSSLRDRQAVARVNARIRRLSEGHAGDMKPLRESVSELRIDYGPGYRVYFMRRGPNNHDAYNERLYAPVIGCISCGEDRCLCF